MHPLPREILRGRSLSSSPPPQTGDLVRSSRSDDYDDLDGQIQDEILDDECGDVTTETPEQVQDPIINPEVTTSSPRNPVAPETSTNGVNYRPTAPILSVFSQNIRGCKNVLTLEHAIRICSAENLDVYIRYVVVTQKINLLVSS